MKKTLLLIYLLLIGFSFTSIAAVISEGQAEKIASSFLKKDGNAQLKSIDAPLNIAYTKVKDGVNLLYVFNKGEKSGYVVVAGDDEATPILGYSYSGTFDAKSIPENMQWWLDEYARQIEYMQKSTRTSNNYAQYDNKYVPKNSHAAYLEPLLKEIAWGQDYPFNEQCPTLNGKHSPTGCVATAMAQIMDYYKYPANGTGSNSYQWNGTTLSADFSQSTYDWASICDYYYNNDRSSQSNNAVAALMRDVGISVNMAYAENSSAASSRDVHIALSKYFGYDAGICEIPRDCYGINDWINILKDELNANHPVYYNGTGVKGGHAFVCDGYNSNNYFHFNWGWQGLSNGYFALTALNPSALGIGGGSGGYIYDQSITAAIQPDTHGATTAAVPYISTNKQITTSVNSVSLGDLFTIQFHGIQVNNALDDVNYILGIGFYDKDKKLFFIYNCGENTFYPTGTFDISMKIPFPTSFSDGTYYIQALYKGSSSSTWEKVKAPFNYPYLVAVVSNGVATFTDESAYITASNLNVSDGIYEGKGFSGSAVISNPTADEYYGTVRVAIYSNSREEWESNDYLIDCLGGEQQTFSFKEMKSPVPAGDYTLKLIDSKQNILAECPITINALPGDGAIISQDKNGTINGTSIDPATNLPLVPKNNIEHHSWLKNTGTADFVGTLYLQVWESQSNQYSIIMKSQDLILKVGESKEVVFNTSLGSGTLGDQCRAGVWTSNEYSMDIYNKLLCPVDFILDAESGIESANTNGISIAPNPASESITITTPQRINNIEIYNLQGSKVMEVPSEDNTITVDISALAPSTYIVRILTEKEVITRKFIKK